MNDQKTCYGGTKDKCRLVQRICVYYLDSNCLSCKKNWTPMLALVGLMAGRVADKIQLDFEILKILHNHLDFYFVYSSVMLLLVL